MNWIADYYLWIKSLHIISLISWMAGLFYLPRLFVYHAQETHLTSETSEKFKIMEYKLLKYITTPAMLATWFFGILLILTPGFDWSQGWMHAKLLLVLLMSGFHGACSKWRKDFLNNRNTKTERFFRIANEIPTLLLIIIVILVVVKPF